MKNTTLLILLSLFIISCDEDNPVSGSNEVDVDWVLVKTPNFYQELWDSESNENISLTIFGESSNLGLLLFPFSNKSFFNISSSN